VLSAHHTNHKSRLLAHSQVVPTELVVSFEVHHAVDCNQQRNSQEEADENAGQAGRFDRVEDIAAVFVVGNWDGFLLEQSAVV
jgi:hypothetical protein